MNSNKQEKITVITTHINSDFDAIGSMLAAQKLYPNAKVVFPGSPEKSPRDFFISSMVYLFNMVSIHQIDFNCIERLVLVDTRQPDRIGKFSEIINQPGLDIHIYDHHPKRKGDIVGNFEVTKETGATVTIMTQILKEKNVHLTSEEATVLCLGIYEDTGSFNFPSTRVADFEAAAYLLSAGANLNTISNMISREITPQQVGCLNDMISSAVRHNINGIDVLITTVSTDDYVSDFASVVHKLMKMESPNALFALARMGPRIHLIARSRVNEVDVGAIVRIFGGGGHTYAASANIKDKTMVQVQSQLLELLCAKINSRQARSLMSSPAIKTSPDTTIEEAKNILQKYNINALLITSCSSEQHCLEGLISRQIIERALYHNLHHIPVKEYMTSELEVVSPDADMIDIQKKIIGNKQRVLPVVDNNIIVGVITRSDILNAMLSHSQRVPENPPDKWQTIVHARTRRVLHFLKERLPERILNLLKQIGEVADQIGCDAYVVGGFVRDLLLDRKNEDIDIVIEGDGIAFAKKYAKIVNARIHTHEKFGTAVIIFKDGFKIDIASARTEYYESPAALPTVERSSIKLDLYRRDFTINTLVIQLNANQFGSLVDFFSAYQDLKEKSIRVLHNLSFVEDPTRVFRAIRFEQRFDFIIGKLTANLITNAVKMNFFQNLGGRRFFAELKLILEEEHPIPAILRMHEFNLYPLIHQALTIDTKLTSLFHNVKKVIDWHDLLFVETPVMKWAVYFLTLIHSQPKQIIKEICTTLELPQKFERIFCDDKQLADKTIQWLVNHNRDIKNHILYQHLHCYKTELILYMMATAPHEDCKRLISHYYTQLRSMTILLKGKDLLEMNISPGPIFTQILSALLNARLDNQLKTKADEIEFVKQYLKDQNN